MNKISLSPEEISLIMKHRQEQYDKNRPDKNYQSPCQFVEYDMEGVHCQKGHGRGVGNHCWARFGKECKYYIGEKNNQE